jgi:hypothetical protein
MLDNNVKKRQQNAQQLPNILLCMAQQHIRELQVFTKYSLFLVAGLSKQQHEAQHKYGSAAVCWI